MQPRSSPRSAAVPPISAKALTLKLEELARGITLDEFDNTPEARRIATLAADRLLLDRVMIDGYQGKAWERLREALAAYAFQIARAWLTTGKMFRVCAEKGFGAQKPLPRRGEDEIVELAGLIVAEALGRFRERVLRPGLWDPLQGATLKTYFVGMCVRVFPKVYRPWRTHILKVMQVSGTNVIPERPDPTPDAVALLSAEARLTELASAPDQPILARLAADWTSAEIAEDLNLTVRSVDSRIFRMREPWRTAT